MMVIDLQMRTKHLIQRKYRKQIESLLAEATHSENGLLISRYI